MHVKNMAKNLHEIFPSGRICKFPRQKLLNNHDEKENNLDKITSNKQNETVLKLEPELVGTWMLQELLVSFLALALDNNIHKKECESLLNRLNMAEYANILQRLNFYIKTTMLNNETSCSNYMSIPSVRDFFEFEATLRILSPSGPIKCSCSVVDNAEIEKWLLKPGNKIK